MDPKVSKFLELSNKCFAYLGSYDIDNYLNSFQDVLVLMQEINIPNHIDYKQFFRKNTKDGKEVFDSVEMVSVLHQDELFMKDMKNVRKFFDLTWEDIQEDQTLEFDPLLIFMFLKHNAGFRIVRLERTDELYPLIWKAISKVTQDAMQLLQPVLNYFVNGFSTVHNRTEYWT